MKNSNPDHIPKTGVKFNHTPGIRTQRDRNIPTCPPNIANRILVACIEAKCPNTARAAGFPNAVRAAPLFNPYGNPNTGIRKALNLARSEPEPRNLPNICALVGLPPDIAYPVTRPRARIEAPPYVIYMLF